MKNEEHNEIEVERWLIPFKSKSKWLLFLVHRNDTFNCLRKLNSCPEIDQLQYLHIKHYQEWSLWRWRNIGWQNTENKHILDDAPDDCILSEQTLPKETSLFQDPLGSLILKCSKSFQTHQIWKVIENLGHSHLHCFSCNPFSPILSSNSIP